jgi:hypothetical protein
MRTQQLPSLVVASIMEHAVGEAGACGTCMMGSRMATLRTLTHLSPGTSAFKRLRAASWALQQADVCLRHLGAPRVLGVGSRSMRWTGARLKMMMLRERGYEYGRYGSGGGGADADAGTGRLHLIPQGGGGGMCVPGAFIRCGGEVRRGAWRGVWEGTSNGMY